MDTLAALRLQIEWGADEALDDAPLDRLAQPPARPAPAALPAPSRQQASPAGPRPAPAALAQAVADGANTIEALRQALAAFTACPLAATATRLVFADGNPAAGLVIVGDVPGAEEDVAGLPFQGPAGRLLDRMFASIGLSRADMLLTSLVPWRPPGGRPPTDAEVQTCAPFLWRHLTLLRPRLVVAAGTLPARLLTGRTDTLRKLRGRWAQVAVPGLPAPIPVLPMFGPGALLASPAFKREAWGDLVLLRRALDGIGT